MALILPTLGMESLEDCSEDEEVSGLGISCAEGGALRSGLTLSVFPSYVNAVAAPTKKLRLVKVPIVGRRAAIVMN
jgi:hypothetical protein